MLKLLVVDDEKDICDFVKNFFKERDFNVFVAFNGEEALEIVRSSAPDILLLDVKMPKMDGLQTLKAVQKMDPAPKTIMVTAVQDSEKAEDAKRHGAVDYITKPLLLEQLERKVLEVAEQIKMKAKEQGAK